MTLTLYRLTNNSTEGIYDGDRTALVLATSEVQARACVTHGPGSLWDTVKSCTTLFTCDVEACEEWPANAGGYVVGQRMATPHKSATPAEHPICKDCVHRWSPEGPPMHHHGQWCYMFLGGDHVDEQGYCGQHRTRPVGE